MPKSPFSSPRAAKASSTRGRRAVLETLEPRVVLNGTVAFNEISYHPADGEGKTAQDLPLSGQIIRAVRAYDAMIDVDPYEDDSPIESSVVSS